MPGDAPILIEQTAEFYRRVALKANDEILVRACLLLAAAQLERLDGAAKKDAPPKAVNDDTH